MSLLEEIQNAAVVADSNLGELLRRCKVLAARLESKPLEEWLVWESDGYPNDAEVPDYRVWSLQLRGHFAGPFQSGIRNAFIPMLFVPEETREKFKAFRCRQSIASIEELLRRSDSETCYVSADSLALLLGTNVYENQSCIAAWAEFGQGNLIEVLNTVRNRILDFVLAIWKDDPKAGEIGQGAERISTQKVNQVFNTTVYGGAASIVGSTNESTLTFNVEANNFELLQHSLCDAGVESEDIERLRAAIHDDPAPPEPPLFGPRVADWIATMVGKAASGAWKISVGASGSLLATLLGKYYGLIP